MTDWSLLGGNPAPGSPGVFEDVAHALAPIVDHGESSSSSVRTMAQQAGSSSWSGTAAKTFAEAVSAIPNDLGALVVANQRAISALNTYSETLTTLQSQASQVLNRAQGDQNDINSASSSLGAAESSYLSADAEYEYFRLKVDGLEGLKFVAHVAGDVTEEARLESEILSASQSRNTAWNQRNDASQRISSSKSALKSAENNLADERANAKSIASQRNDAIVTFVAHMTTASDFVIKQRSWLDRVRQDFDSVTGIEIAKVVGVVGTVYAGVEGVKSTVSDTSDLVGVARDGGDSAEDFDPLLQGVTLMQDQQTVDSDLASSDTSVGHRLETTGDIGNELGDGLIDASIDATVSSGPAGIAAAPAAGVAILLGESLKAESDVVNLAGFGLEHEKGIEQGASDVAKATKAATSDAARGIKDIGREEDSILDDL